jgi:quercetin dioxygenase-like cupin family protein
MLTSGKALHRTFASIFSLLVATAACGPVLAEAPSSVKVDTLLKTDSAWDGTRYEAYPSGQPQITVQRIEVPPHSSLPWHTHPMPIAGYVVSGEITVEKPDGEKRTVLAGQVLPETVGSVHRGTTGEQPVTLIVFYAGVDGMPLSRQKQ